ncbi:hypothetical protein ACE193_25390 (plasmid) [Bernardetia sp. OM2101]|uniref:hypothetical protein n=1 Tax=Bernardetia sp. OM2101 TaxID=3344876 RepID=UPI0035CE9016
MKKYIIIGLLSLVTFSLKAQVNQVYWKETLGAKMTSPTSFEPLKEAVLASAYSINELAPHQDGEVKAQFGEATSLSILALTRKQGQKVLISGDTYGFQNNLDFYIKPFSKGYEVNGKKIEMNVSSKDVVSISRKEDIIHFTVNDKIIYQIQAEQTHEFPLVAVVFTYSKEEITNLSFTTTNQQELVLDDEVVAIQANRLGSITINNVYGGTAPYTYSWTHSKETTPTIKGLEQGNYTVVVTDAKGKEFKKDYLVTTQLTWVEAFNTTIAFDKEYYTDNIPVSLKSRSYIEQGKNGKIEWLEADIRGNLYIGFVEKKQTSKFIKNDLKYAFLMEEKLIHVVFEGKIIKSFPRPRNRNTSYSIEKKDGFIVYSAEKKVIVKEQIKEESAFSVKVILIENAKLTQLKGLFTATDLQETINNSTQTNQKQTTAYYKNQPVVWIADGIENSLPALRDGEIEWTATADAVWFETEDKKEIYKFETSESLKKEIATYRIERNGYTMSFYKNNIFHYSLPTDAEKNLIINSSQNKGFDITASFGNCSSPFGPTNTWYFGDHAGLSFTTSPPSAIVNEKLYANEGCGIVSDYNGNVRFYTNGLEVWDKNHDVMKDGSGLDAVLEGHTSSSQIGLIVPAPSDPDKYYIFHSKAMEDPTVSGTNPSPLEPGKIELYFSTVVFDATSPDGRVELENILVSDQLGERITAVKHKTLNAYWIITHERSSANFQSYLLGETGFLDPNNPSISLGDNPLPFSKSSLVKFDFFNNSNPIPFNFQGQAPTSPNWYINGQFKFSPDGKYLAVANNQPNSATFGIGFPGIFLMPYDATTGQVGDVVLFDRTEAEASYGIEFSADGKFLYAVRKYCDPSNFDNPELASGVFQYEIALQNGGQVGNNNERVRIGTIPPVLTSPGSILAGDPAGGSNECYGAMQLGSDRKIYITRAGQSVLGVINYPEIAGLGAEYRHDGVGLDVPSTTQRIEKSLYGFPSFVQSFLPCSPITFNQTSIGPLSTSSYQLNVTDLTNIAPHEVNNYTYQWSTGATTPTINVFSSGTYSLTIKYNNVSCGEVCSFDNQVEVLLETNLCSPFPNDKKWYFGKNAGLDFTTTPPTPLMDGKTTAGEGLSLISDENGDLLFYTDGQTVWNSNHQIFDDGTGLITTRSSSQGIMVIEKPQTPNRYYIFHTTGAETYNVKLYYTEVEIGAIYPQGRVIDKNIPIGSQLVFTERLGAITKSNGIDYWLLIKQTNSDKFYTYSITQNGVDVTNPIISVGLNVSNTTGEIAFSSDGQQVGISTGFGPASGVVEVYTFDRNTGSLGSLVFKDQDLENAYGIEFSPNSKLLYVSSRELTTKILYQYDLEANDIATSKIIIAEGTEIASNGPYACCHLGNLQTAPDGKIYWAKWNIGSMGVINNPNERGRIPCGYVDEGIILGGKFSTSTLPAYPTKPVECQTFSLGIDRTVAIGQTTTLAINAADNPNFSYTPTSYLWSTNENTPNITVSTAGTYTLTITYINDCDIECTVSDDITITFQNNGSPCEAPLQITDIYSCNSYILTAEDGFQDYEWNTGEQGRSIVVQNAGEYIVTAFDPVLNCIRKGIFYASFNEFCYEEISQNSTTTEYKEVLSVSVVNYSDIWLKNTTENTSKNPFLNAQKGVWRADASFAYMQDRSASEEVDISKDGSFSLQMLDWKQNGNVFPSSWRKVATLEQYNADGFEVENRDILGRYSSALYGYQNQLSTAVATNAKYHEIVFDGFEEYTTDNFQGHGFLTTSNLDVFRVYPTLANLTINVPVYRHYNVAWGTGNTAIVETSTGRDMSNFSASLKIMPVSSEAPRIEENVNLLSLNTTGIRLSEATFSGVSLPARWKGNMAFKTTAKLTPIYEQGIDVDVAQNYGHTGKKSLKVTQNISYEQVRFDPAPGRQYVVSLWVSVKDADVPTFNSASDINQDAKRGIKIKFEGSTEEFFFEPTGRIIEGWQRIEGTFCVPQQYDKLYLTFQTGNETTYFDDIRFHPFNGNLQTYVYDPENYLLRAVLDRNNFATFYYYDSEQQLRLVKKETERGVKTIQEVISNMPSK